MSDPAHAALPTEAPAPAFDDQLVNILIVDDEPKNLTVLETVLIDPRYRLVRAESADQAFLSLISADFALIILDVQMPDMNGFELAQMIKQRKKTAEVPIIFLTAYYSEDQHVLEGYSTGAVDYLHKPLSPAILRSKVAVFIDLYCKTRECSLAADRMQLEVAERRRAQEELLLLNRELEHRVGDRTAELRAVLQALGESEERLRLANEASGTGLWELNLQTRDLKWSPECYEMHGVAPDTFEVGVDSAFDLIHADDRERVRTTISSAVEERRVYACDFRIRRPDGTTRWVTTKGRAFFDDDHRPRRMIGTMIDISYRKEIEQQLLCADRQKDEFLATLAHELRNPLAPIRNAVQLLLNGIENSELKWAGEVIERQLRQMTRLVDDLLEVSRITTGKLKTRKELLELTTVVREAVETSLPLIEHGKHDLKVALPSQPLFVNADRVRLAQVFSNLLNNAAKYMEPGGRIALNVETTDHQAVVSIKDSGIGIPAEMLSRIFEMFTQVDRNSPRSQGGLGIGLTLVKRLVEIHGGSVEAHSSGAGCGSEFVVRLPIAVDAMPTTTAAPRNQQLASNGAELRILVADDNEDGANTLGKMLQIMGNEVRIVHDGLAAVEAAEAFRPAVVLLDIGMPILDGYDACRRIRAQPWGTALVLIAITGWGQDEDRQRTSEAGFDHHLVKPVEIAALAKLLAGVAVSA